MPVTTEDLISNFPLIIRTYEKQNSLLDNLASFLGGHYSVSLVSESTANEAFGGRDHASYDAGRRDAFCEVMKFYKDNCLAAGLPL